MLKYNNKQVIQLHIIYEKIEVLSKIEVNF